MANCVYSDYISGSGGDLGSPDSLADDSFSDSETSSTLTGGAGTAADMHAATSGPVSLDYLADFLTDHPGVAAAASGTGTGKGARSKGGRKPCKYVPHAEKPGHVVAKRNARERRRVEAVNSAFVRLRKVVPHENRRKRISKVKTLRVAMDYISYLQDLIDDYDKTQRLHAMADMHHHHHQQHHHNHHPLNHHGGHDFNGAPHPAYLPDTHSPTGNGWSQPTQHLTSHHHHQQHQHQVQGHHHPLPTGPEASPDAPGGEARYAPAASCLPPPGIPHSLYYPQEPILPGYGQSAQTAQCGEATGGWPAPKLYAFDHSQRPNPALSMADARRSVNVQSASR